MEKLEKFKIIIKENVESFIIDFLGLEGKGNRAKCPFCHSERKDFTFCLFDSGFWGCYHSNCDASKGIGDSVDLAILLKHNLSPQKYKNLDKETKKKYFKEACESIEKWCLKYCDSLDDIKVSKESYRSHSVRIDEKLKNAILNINEKDNEKILFDKISFSSKETKNKLLDYLKKSKIENNEKFIYDFIDFSQKNGIYFIYQLKLLSNVLQENYFENKTISEVKDLMKKSIVSSKWKRFNEGTIKKFKIFDWKFVNGFDYSSIKYFKNYHFYSILDENGRLVGFQGRRKENEELNSKEKEFRIRSEKNGFETPKCLNLRSFERRNIIYNLCNSKNNKKYIVIHEGPADVIKASEFGVDAISFLGRTMSEQQFELLKENYSKTTPVFVALDNDEAGREGAKSIIETLKTYFTKVFLTVFTNFKDPGDAEKAQYVSSLQNSIPK